MGGLPLAGNRCSWVTTAIVMALFSVMHTQTLVCDDIVTRYPKSVGVLEISVRHDVIWCMKERFFSILDKQTGQWEHTYFTSSGPQYEVPGSENGPIWVRFSDNDYRLEYFEEDGWKKQDRQFSGVSISAFMSDSSCRDWITTESNGIYCNDGGNWLEYAADHFYKSVAAMAHDGSGALWFASGDGLRMFDGHTLTTYSEVDGDPGGRAGGVAIDENDTVWIGADDGVYRFDGGVFEHVLTNDTFGVMRVYDLSIDRIGAVWVCAHRGVLRYFDGTWEIFSETDELIDNVTNDMAVDSHNNIWFCHKNAAHGVTMFDGDEWRWFTTWNTGLPAVSYTHLTLPTN